jgi:hypothetical protein
MTEVPFSVEARFSLPGNVQIGFGTNSASYPISTEGHYPGVKRPMREADHSPPTSAEVKNDGAIPPLPHMS